MWSGKLRRAGRASVASLKEAKGETIPTPAVAPCEPGGTAVDLNLGGSIETVPNAVRVAELAVDKQAQTLLMPVGARRQLNDLPDDLWTRVSIEFYKDAPDAVFKSLVE